MSSNYMYRVLDQTPTRFWVNNPSDAETILAIAHRAVNCTTNPAFCSKILVSDGAYTRAVIDEVIREESDDDVAADLVYQRCSKRIMEHFLPLYEWSKGAFGYVTVQADPREDEDPDKIVNAALRHRKLGPNYMAKIPVTEAGTLAIEALVARDIPVCATEVFSLSQAVAMCERWERAVQKAGKRPPFFITHITGIYDQYLAGVVKQQGLSISPESMYLAGTLVGRKEYHLLKERGYRTTLLGGGARGAQHWTEFVGGEMDITINWATAQELIALDPPVVSRIDTPAPAQALQELDAKLADWRRGWHEGALALHEFKEFGPVQLFRNMFIAGWTALLHEIAARRKGL